MKYDHIVKYNGVFYAAGEEVPDDFTPSVLKESENEKAESFLPLPFEPPKYKKSDITRMSKAELQDLASNIGIENAYQESGESLKKTLIDYFGL